MEQILPSTFKEIKLESDFKFSLNCHEWEISQGVCVSIILVLMPMINICAVLLEIAECLLEGPS